MGPVRVLLAQVPDRCRKGIRNQGIHVVTRQALHECHQVVDILSVQIQRRYQGIEVLIGMPTLIKAGFIWGGSGGNGVAIASSTRA